MGPTEERISRGPGLPVTRTGARTAPTAVSPRNLHLAAPSRQVAAARAAGTCSHRLRGSTASLRRSSRRPWRPIVTSVGVRMRQTPGAAETISWGLQIRPHPMGRRARRHQPPPPPPGAREGKAVPLLCGAAGPFQASHLSPPWQAARRRQVAPKQLGQRARSPALAGTLPWLPGGVPTLTRRRCRALLRAHFSPRANTTAGGRHPLRELPQWAKRKRRRRRVAAAGADSWWGLQQGPEPPPHGSRCKGGGRTLP